MMPFTRYRVIPMYFLITLLGMFLAGCQEYFPEDFHDTEIEIAALDRSLCDHLADTLQVEVSTNVRFHFQNSWAKYPTIPDTSWVPFPDSTWVWVDDTTRVILPATNWIIVPDSSWLLTIGDTSVIYDTVKVIIPDSIWNEALNVSPSVLEATRDQLIDNLTAEVIDSLEVSNIKLAKATSQKVATPANWNTNYTLFDSDATGNIAVVVDDYVQIEFLEEDRTVLESIDDTIALGTIAGCPDLKTRTVFTLENARYLVRITKTEQTADHTFGIAVLDQE